MRCLSQRIRTAPILSVCVHSMLVSSPAVGETGTEMFALAFATLINPRRQRGTGLLSLFVQAEFPLCAACFSGSRKIVELLMKFGACADPSDKVCIYFGGPAPRRPAAAAVAGSTAREALHAAAIMRPGCPPHYHHTRSRA